MKLNEPIKSGGVGRKQIAWNTDKDISEQTILQEAANDPDTTSAHSPIGTLAETLKLARVAAYSAASSAIANNENRIWSTQSLKRWTHIASNLTSTFSYIHWADDVDNLGNIRTGLAYVDTQDPTIIRVTKTGWYLVNAHFYEGDHQLNNNKSSLSITNVDSPDTATGKAYNYVTGYPSLSISQLVSVPGYRLGTPASPDDNFGQGGFQVLWEIGPHQNNLDISATNSYAFIQIVWLMPWESNLFYNGA